MTTEGLRVRERGDGPRAVEAVGERSGAGHGARAEGGPRTAVAVIPLWDRLRTEVHG
ncbi:hypothetical protein OK074_8665 [Actinobacteria bacterium OK074]|nr:hypothetical protein OK074_8665 [Actinobacteria bacterium OK074]